MQDCGFFLQATLRKGRVTHVNPLNYRPPDERYYLPQKVGAVAIGASGAFMTLAIRVYSAYQPGDYPWLLLAFIVGWVFVIVGAVWYLACRKAEG